MQCIYLIQLHVRGRVAVNIWQNRPIIWQKRPITRQHRPIKNACVYIYLIQLNVRGRTAVIVRQKRPITRKRDLLQGKETLLSAMYIPHPAECQREGSRRCKAKETYYKEKRPITRQKRPITRQTRPSQCNVYTSSS